MQPIYLLHQDRPRQPRVALAVVAVLMSVFLFGLVEIGSAIFTQYIVRSAAIEGVRYAIAESTARPQGEQVVEYVRGYMVEAGLDAQRAVVVVTGAAGQPGQKTMVDITYPARLLVMTMLLDWAPAVPAASADTGSGRSASPARGQIMLHGKAMGVFE
ncbi:MAG TPA: hypothetical protein VEC57_14410 [Candidatus Limnocylindrales bacterium]|nr:hypothetical protein [Candidatus Limnocylindrales bacterium]